MMRHIAFIHLQKPLMEFAEQKPIFGTCAGLILMSHKIVADKMIPFGILNLSVERNAFGRQAESFKDNVEITNIQKNPVAFPAVFIRAPRIRHCGSNVQVLGSYHEEPVFIQQGIHLGATFHPELTGNSAIHQYFLNLVKQTKLY